MCQTWSLSVHSDDNEDGSGQWCLGRLSFTNTFFVHFHGSEPEYKFFLDLELNPPCLDFSRLFLPQVLRGGVAQDSPLGVSFDSHRSRGGVNRSPTRYLFLPLTNRSPSHTDG